MDWNYILSFMGGSAAFFAAAAWLTRALIMHRLAKEAADFKANLSKDVEQYKANLLAEHNLTLERFKSDLHQISTEHQIRFASLHQKRAEIIEELYNKIVETHDTTELCLDAFEEEPNKSQQELAEEAIRRGDDLAEFVIRNKIYFSPFLASELSELHICLLQIGIRYSMYCEESDKSSKREEFIGLLGEVKVDTEGAMRTTESEFRKILGVEVTTDEDVYSKFS